MRDDELAVQSTNQESKTYGGRAETPTRKQRLERSLRPSSARFTSPPKMRDRFDTWKTGRSHVRRQKKQSTRQKPPHLKLSHSSEEASDASWKHFSHEKVTTPHAGEEIIFTTSTSSGKDEFRQDSEHSGSSSHRTGKIWARKYKRDGSTSTASEDDSAEIGFEVSVKNADTASLEASEGKDDENRPKEEMGKHRGDSSSGRSSVVFDFSGISKTKSTELVVGDGPDEQAPTDSVNSDAFVTLYQEIEKIVSRLSLTTVRTPKAANRSNQITNTQNAFHQYYFSAKTLTSVYSNGEELSFGMHAEIMKMIGDLNADSPAEQKQGIVLDLFKMGIRVLGRQSTVTIEENVEESNTDTREMQPNGSESTHSIQSNGQNNSSCRETNSLSSNEIDRRWEAYRAKYMERRTPNSSDEIDDQWDRFRERALTNQIDKMDSGALSLTSDMEDDLIRDCIETGLPSPRMTQTWGGTEKSSRLHRQDSAHDDKTSLQAPTAHSQSMYNRRMPIQAEIVGEVQNQSSSDLLQKRGQPDIESCNQPPMMKRVTTSDEPRESVGKGGFDAEDADPILSIGDAERSDGLRSAVTDEKTDDCSTSFVSNQLSATDRDDETISSELSGQGAVNHFKSLSTSGRETDRIEILQADSKTTEKESTGSKSLVTQTDQVDDEKVEVGEDESACCVKGVIEDTERDNNEKPGIEENDSKKHDRPMEFLQRVLSSAASSCSTASRSIRQKMKGQPEKLHEKVKEVSEIPSKPSESLEDTAKCPRIEVTLLMPRGGMESIGDDSRNEDSQSTASNEEHSASDETLNGSGDLADRVEQEPPKSFREERTILKTGSAPPKMNDLFHDDVDILEISSSLTGGTRGSEGRSSSAGKKTESRMYQHSQPIDLSITGTKGKSFESSSSFSNHGVPSWRLDPSDSLSDFELQISIEGREEVTSYHIHRHMLAVGPRRSEFMEEVFRSESANTYLLSLDEKTSSYMPRLLDYIYCFDHAIEVTSENAMALRQLGKIFKVVPLVVKVAGFILEDLKCSTLSSYVSESSFYHDIQVTELIVRRCAENLQTVGVGDPLWAVMDPELFLRVLSSPLINRRVLSPHLSILVVEFISLHQYEIDMNLFTSLTSEEIIPTVDREAALPLIELCEEYRSERCEALQKRCAHTMACFWKTTSHEDRHRLFALLRNLPSAFTVDFLEIVESGRSSDNTSHGMDDKAAVETSEREIAERFSFSIGDLCDDLAGDDGYSVSGTDEVLLSWRLDPDLSFSDWTIKVIHQNLNLCDSYHVHKQILSLGPYRSEFFARVLFSKDFQTEGQSVTAVELDHEAAVVFPQVLDFIYTPDHSLQMTHENAIVLRFLARVLGISLLSKMVLEFICKDITLENVISYLKGSYLYEDERIQTVASKLCATQIQSIDMDSPLLEEFKPDFFARVVASSDIKDSSKCHLTILITKYFSLHNLDEDILAELLKHVEVPRIDYLSAMKLLKILSTFERSQEIETFDRLQRRCANILTENWNDIRDNHREEVFLIFPLLHPTILTGIFDVIDRQYMVQHYESMSLQSRLVKRYRAQVAEANHLREQEVFLLQKELEERTHEMLTIQQALEEKLGRVNDSLNRRTGRSAAYGIHLPSSPVHSPRGKMETRIPCLRTKSPSTLAAERIKAAREAARKELNSATPCCPYPPAIQDRDDVSEAEPATASVQERVALVIDAAETTPSPRSTVAGDVPSSHYEESNEDHQEGEAVPKEAKPKQPAESPWSPGAADEGEDAELSA
jgi:BTB/POZ domain